MPIIHGQLPAAFLFFAGGILLLMLFPPLPAPA